jgi:hypothetical protein
MKWNLSCSTQCLTNSNRLNEVRISISFCEKGQGAMISNVLPISSLSNLYLASTSGKEQERSEQFISLSALLESVICNRLQKN